ncbi:MAG: glycosyltransferase family 2 protein [Pseudomonadota bacterium]
MSTEADQNTLDVSVVIAAYKAEAFLQTAVHSALAQEGVTLEVIIVDDASPNSLAPVAEQAAGGDPRVKFIRLPENRGPSAARNAALDVARGRYIAVLDADDTMAANRLQTMIAAAEGLNSEIIVDNVISYSEQNEPVSDQALIDVSSIDLPFEVQLSTYIDPRDTNTVGRLMGYLKPILKRDFLIENDIRYDEALRNSEDYYLVAELLIAGAKMNFIDLVGYRYTIRSGSISHRICERLAEKVLEKEISFQKDHQHVLVGELETVSQLRLDVLERQYALAVFTQGIIRRKPLMLVEGVLWKLRHAPYVLASTASIIWNKLRRRNDAPPAR